MANIKTKGFLYDPQTDGYNAYGEFWRRYTGASDPSVVSNNLRITGSVGVISIHQLTGEWDVEFKVTIPTNPTAGDSRSWDLTEIALSNRGRVGFNISGTTFSLLAYDNAGTQLTVYNYASGAALTAGAYTWNTAWTAAATRFRVRNSGMKIEFYADNIKLGIVTPQNSIPTLPVKVRIFNDEADNMDVASVIETGIESISS